MEVDLLPSLCFFALLLETLVPSLHSSRFSCFLSPLGCQSFRHLSYGCCVHCRTQALLYAFFSVAFALIKEGEILRVKHRIVGLE